MKTYEIRIEKHVYDYKKESRILLSWSEVYKNSLLFYKELHFYSCESLQQIGLRHLLPLLELIWHILSVLLFTLETCAFDLSLG